MSGQTPQRVRPSTKQGPMKAVKTFTLIHKSKPSPTKPTGRKSPASSPIPVRTTETHRLRTRGSPDSRASPERPSSPNFKVERPKAVKGSPAPQCLHTIGPYLRGQWPQDANAYHNSARAFMCDKSTQTSGEWENSGNTKKGHKRSASSGHGDQQKVVQLIKQRLQKTKEGSKQTESNKARQSPVPGNHLALSSTTYIPIPHIPKPPMSRYQRSSVEGLNPEIEKLTLRPISGSDAEENDKAREIPDGHRAPVIELSRGSSTRSIDTQTPSRYSDGNRSNRSSSCSSRSRSVSPAIPIIPGLMDTSNPSSRAASTDTTAKESNIRLIKGDPENAMDSIELTSIMKRSASPKPNSSFIREPPDGCERVKVIEETRSSQPAIKELQLFWPVKPSKFVLRPSKTSAFYPPPLYKTYLSANHELPIISPASCGSQTAAIEGQ